MEQEPPPEADWEMLIGLPFPQILPIRLDHRVFTKAVTVAGDMRRQGENLNAHLSDDKPPVAGGPERKPPTVQDLCRGAVQGISVGPSSFEYSADHILSAGREGPAEGDESTGKKENPWLGNFKQGGNGVERFFRIRREKNIVLQHNSKGLARGQKHLMGFVVAHSAAIFPGGHGAVASIARIQRGDVPRSNLFRNLAAIHGLDKNWSKKRKLGKAFLEDIPSLRLGCQMDDVG
jgi:hypothetical protein